MMSPAELYGRALRAFARRVEDLGYGDWSRPTPCEEWDVRALVNHVTAENLWAVELLAGATSNDVGDRFDGDVLGGDPKASWREAAARALEATGRSGISSRMVQLSTGLVEPGEYLMQLFADHLIHAWDLARAVGADERLDPELVAACSSWFDAVEDEFRERGLIGPAVPVGPDADAEVVLLGRFGRRV
jgi:uncharacterized protein (TIGR03086 family)